MAPNAAAMTDAYIEVLTAIRTQRPNITWPAEVLTARREPPPWNTATLRSVYVALTTHLRGQVEDAGYDPDLLPEPAASTLDVDPEHPTLLILTGSTGALALTEHLKGLHGAQWDAGASLWRITPTGAGLPGLRQAVKDYRVTPSPEAISLLRDLATQVDANPEAAAHARVSVAGTKVQVTPTGHNPALVAAVRRIQGFKFDGTTIAGPVTKLREVLGNLGPWQVHLEASAETALQVADAPLVYDGTLDGLRGVPLDDLACMRGAKPERFAEFGVENVFDLLMHVPLRYIDRSSLTPIRSLAIGEDNTVLGKVASISVDPKRRLVRIYVKDATGKLTVTFFNAIWQAKRFREGDEVLVWGKVETWQSTLQMTNPIMDVVGNDTLAVVPVYPQSAKSRVTTWEIAQAVAEALRRLGPLTDPIPQSIVDDFGLMPRAEALRLVHLPPSPEAAGEARRRLAFDELFRMQAALLLKRQTEGQQVGIAHTPSGTLTAALLASLPFGLTGAQQRVTAELAADMAAPHPLHRLIQGDVGSGKSIVALLALLTAVDAGYQGALMAPTEILANQLYNELAERTTGMEVREGVPLRVAFLGNRVRGKARDALLADVASGQVHILVGTHALLEAEVLFHHLSLVVIDEQHRFGVEQRATLRAKGPVIKGVQVQPDAIVMTATPIPRTASMTVFGDLSVSILDELPPGRTPIATSWIDAEVPLGDPLAAPWVDLRAEVAAGRQAYVVCPLVEESEKLQVASATATFEALQSGALAGLRVGLVHGQLKSEERDATMSAFRAGDLDVIVATTVIEVGVNVPNATMIVILDPSRFGIAQLHQLRGRVGRGVHASRCVLAGRCVSSDARARMEALVASTDGFVLSEVDLQLRGHGSVFGTAQSGRSDLRVANLDTDRDLLEQAREAAGTLLETDPGFARRPGLRAEIRAVLGDEAQEWLGKS